MFLISFVVFFPLYIQKMLGKGLYFVVAGHSLSILGFIRFSVSDLNPKLRTKSLTLMDLAHGVGWVGAPNKLFKYGCKPEK